MSNDFQAYDAHYARMDNTEPNWSDAERNPRRFACSKPWLPPNQDARVLDFGCGWGQQLLALWCAGYKNLEGVELSPNQAATADRFATGRVAIACMDGRDYLADKQETYDLIVLNDVLEHIPTGDTQVFLECLNAALVPGGILVVRVPNMANLMAAYSRYLDITHVTGYTEYSLMQVLDAAGFVDHRLVPAVWNTDLRKWRPWAPWRGLNLRARADHLLHRVAYWLRGYTQPQCFSHNVEMYTHKPQRQANSHESSRAA